MKKYKDNKRFEKCYIVKRGNSMSYYDCGLDIGQSISNADIVRIYKCGNMGGMRRSHATNTLVIITDYTKGIYHDKWIGGTLHYTGMGKNGDQDINWSQNATLNESNYNGVDVHLFEVLDEGRYIFCGHVKLIEKPYLDTQPGEDGFSRKVWIFPVRPVPENNVIKMPLFTFKDMDDYLANGAAAEAEFLRRLAEYKKKTAKRSTPVKHRAKPEPAPKPEPSKPVVPSQPPKPVFVMPTDLVGKNVKHKSYGDGVITASSDNGAITVLFSSVGEKKLGYKVCMDNHLLSFVS